MKQLNEKHQAVMLKISSGLSAEQTFEKICFQLENNWSSKLYDDW